MWISLYPILSWLSIVLASLFLLVLALKLTEPVRQSPRLPNPLRVEISWRTLGIAAGIVVLALGTRGLVRKLSDRQLHAQASILSSELTTFADERDRQMPPEGQPNWNDYTRHLGQFTDATVALYAQRYAKRVAALRTELLRRGLRDEQLDTYYQLPKTPIVVRTVGERLDYLAKQL
jgi:hypothetical protein